LCLGASGPKDKLSTKAATEKGAKDKDDKHKHKDKGDKDKGDKDKGDKDKRSTTLHAGVCGLASAPQPNLGPVPSPCPRLYTPALRASVTPRPTTVQQHSTWVQGGAVSAIYSTGCPHVD
jgi:hypothetical protein